MRANSRGRGPYRSPRGRPGPPVQDLRERLNRIRSEKQENPEQSFSRQPPPDPPYNYLKDPSRDDSRGYYRDFERETYRNTQFNSRSDSFQRGSYRGRFYDNARGRGRGSYTTDNIQGPGYFDDRSRQRSFHRGRGQFRGPHGGHGPPKQRSRSVEAPRNTESDSHSKTKPFEGNRSKYLEQLKSPMNINVSFSADTGKRTCELDETVRLPEIKHQPNFHEPRGRGRGRSRSFRGHFRGTRRPQNKGSKNQDGASETSEVDSNRLDSEGKQENDASKNNEKNKGSAKNKVEFKENKSKTGKDDASSVLEKNKENSGDKQENLEKQGS